MNPSSEIPRAQPGPCEGCGATGYSLSYGGPRICPACDCGVPPEVSKLRRELAESNKALDFYREAYEKAHARAEALEASRDRLFEQSALHTESDGMQRAEIEGLKRELAEARAIR